MATQAISDRSRNFNTFYSQGLEKLKNGPLHIVPQSGLTPKVVGYEVSHSVVAELPECLSAYRLLRVYSEGIPGFFYVFVFYSKGGQVAHLWQLERTMSVPEFAKLFDQVVKDAAANAQEHFLPLQLELFLLLVAGETIESAIRTVILRFGEFLQDCCGDLNEVGEECAQSWRIWAQGEIDNLCYNAKLLSEDGEKIPYVQLASKSVLYSRILRLSAKRGLAAELVHKWFAGVYEQRLSSVGLAGIIEPASHKYPEY